MTTEIIFAEYFYVSAQEDCLSKKKAESVAAALSALGCRRMDNPTSAGLFVLLGAKPTPAFSARMSKETQVTPSFWNTHIVGCDGSACDHEPDRDREWDPELAMCHPSWDSFMEWLRPHVYVCEPGCACRSCTGVL